MPAAPVDRTIYDSDTNCAAPVELREMLDDRTLITLAAERVIVVAASISVDVPELTKRLVPLYTDTCV